MKTIGLVLSGCGVFDGAEIHESVLTLLALAEQDGIQVQCFAPDIPQLHVINHLTGEVTGESRNVLTEAARIARGEIQDLAQAQAADLDALILPGGFGAAKNLCSFAEQGPAAEVLPELKALITAMHGAGKPIGFICISPAIAALCLGDQAVEVTIGTDAETGAAIEATGAKHLACPVEAIHIDEKNKIISTPAYMLGPGIADVNKGIRKLVDTVVSWL